jgi:hypothetical protein
MGESRGDKVRIWTDVPLHLQPNRVIANCVDGAIIGYRPESCHNHLKDGMQRSTLCSLTLLLLQNSEHMSI